MITIEEFLKGRDTVYPSDYTPEIHANADKLLASVNFLLAELNWNEPGVNSGWRPPLVNRANGGAEHSLHMQGRAIDLEDKTGLLAYTILQNYDVLDKNVLWMEWPTRTPGWVHLDNGDRPARKIRAFLI